MEPRIATLLDQSPYKRLTLDPSVLTTSSPNAHRYIEPAASVTAAPSNLDHHGHHDHADARNKTSSHAQSSAPLARVLNDPSSASQVLQPPPGRQRQQHATLLTGSDGPVLRPPTISPDARRREEHHGSTPYTGGDMSLIQLPKPPQVPRKTAKRPRIPPLLQGLHQPPPLPPKSRLFPPITSDRSGLAGDVGDRFGLGNAFSTNSAEELPSARVLPENGKDFESHDEERGKPTITRQITAEEQGPGSVSTAEAPTVIQSTSRTQNKTKAPRKRTRWSQKETEDLLTGVSRFGIGRWKQILECAEFQFQGRTAVDLKDRFRVCRPAEGLKARKLTTPEAPTVPGSASSAVVDSESTVSAMSVVVQAGPLHQRATLDPKEPANEAPGKLNIYGPFLKSRRRARREFNDEDDANLLKGFKRHGASWHKMRDDFELGFGMRHPTDLRDRFRIRYPDRFAQAGYKLKPKEQRALEEKTDARTQKAQVSRQPTKLTGQTLDNNAKRTSSTTPGKATSSFTPAAATTTSKPTSTRPTFELITDLTFSSSDEDSERSPIVLNRNILQWADENSTPASTSAAPTATTAQAPAHSSTELLHNPFTASDGLHINPLATLKLPSSAHWSYMNPPPVVPVAGAGGAGAAAPSLPPPGGLKHALPPSSSASTSMGNNAANGVANSSTSNNTNNTTNTTATNTANSNSTANSSINNTSSSTTAARTQHDMRTPNLPNIVFPYVPSASARNAVHNLPAPADILSLGQAGAEGWVWIG